MPAFSSDRKKIWFARLTSRSHPMVEAILDKLLPEQRKYFRHTLTALCKENEFIEIMEKMPEEVEFSSLPKLYSDGWRVSISVASKNEKLAFEAFQMYVALLEKKKIVYGLHDESNA